MRGLQRGRDEPSCKPPSPLRWLTLSLREPIGAKPSADATPKPNEERQDVYRKRDPYIGDWNRPPG